MMFRRRYRINQNSDDWFKIEVKKLGLFWDGIDGSWNNYKTFEEAEHQIQRMYEDYEDRKQINSRENMEKRRKYRREHPAIEIRPKR